MIRKIRRVLKPAAKQAIKQQYASDLYLERFLQQQYEDINFKIVKNTCMSFKATNPLCRTCQFFSQRKQKEKFGSTCPIWLTVFGHELRKVIIGIAKNNIKIDYSFIQKWNARRIIPVVSPEKAMLEHVDWETRRRVKTATRQTVMTSISCVIVE